MAYCTDVSFIPPASYPLLEGLDVLVLDALQRKRHITHFSLEQALAEAKKLRARQTLFTHIAHGLGDAETNAELPDTVRLAYDGQRVAARL
jgi:phosphoribosyl 1,2-cyclic phosphate phosphodiesterase